MSDLEEEKASSRFENFKEKLFKQTDKEYGFTLPVIQEKDLEESTVQSSNEKENEKQQEWALRMATEAEEKRKYEAIMKQKHEEKKKLYELKMKKLAAKPPPFPTDDMEDSDDNSSGNTIPLLWARWEALHSTSVVQSDLPEECYQEFFQMQATTPDLREIS